MKEISLEDLYKKSNNLEEGEVLLDVRTPGEFEAGHVKGSINVDHTEVQNHVEDLKKYKTLYIYCRKGRRAQFAYGVLENLGFNNLVCFAAGGTEEWIDEGYPLIS